MYTPWCILGLGFLAGHSWVVSGNAVKFKESRIAFGTPALPGSAPHQASLRPTNNPTFVSCGAVIISQCHILTAAHCNFCAGGNCFLGYGNNDKTLQTRVKIESFTPHSDYVLQPTSGQGITLIQNDIAIIKLPQGSYITPNANAGPIDLNTVEIPIGGQVTITGWGVTNLGLSPNYLLQASMQVKACPASQNNWIYFYCITSLLSGSCPGDSGGPMVYQNRLAGITSYGSPCGNPNANDGYSKINVYVPWINARIAENPC